MARKSKICQAANGLFVRNIGWKATTSGYAQHKFYLGRDQQQAQIISLMLERLWERVTTCYFATDECYRTGQRPAWDEATLAIAEAIRQGASVAYVPLPKHLHEQPNDGLDVAFWIADFRRDFPDLRIELQDRDAYRQAQNADREAFHQPPRPRLGLLGETAADAHLHQALDDYALWVESKFVGADRRVTPWGRTQGRHIAFLRQHLPAVHLRNLDSQQIDDVIDQMRLRPLNRHGAPCSISWTRNCLKQFRNFLSWLHRSPAYEWKRPADFELQRVKIPLLVAERTALGRSSQVQTYSEDEIRQLWKLASPMERLIMLLALNCGFGRAEVASLEMSEVLLRQPHPHAREVGLAPGEQVGSWILRVRPKSGVYGEWKLWPETVAGIEWWLRRRADIQPDSVTALLVNRNGHRFDRATRGNNANYQISNMWQRLGIRARQKQTDFRLLSFNKLRKTAGNWIRAEAGGEIAGIFLCHGMPVRSDGLLDVYTNRPFAHVFAAIDGVAERVRPLWREVADAFSEVIQRPKTNLSRGQIQRIQRLKRQGYTIAHISREVGVSTEAVRRWTRPEEMGKSSQARRQGPTSEHTESNEASRNETES
jgi:hypothetical protein